MLLLKGRDRRGTAVETDHAWNGEITSVTWVEAASRRTISFWHHFTVVSTLHIIWKRCQLKVHPFTITDTAAAANNTTSDHIVSCRLLVNEKLPSYLISLEHSSVTSWCSEDAIVVTVHRATLTPSTRGGSGGVDAKTKRLVAKFVINSSTCITKLSYYKFRKLHLMYPALRVGVFVLHGRQVLQQW